MKYLIRMLILSMLVLFSGCEFSQNTKDSYEPKYSNTPLLKTKAVYIFGVHPLHNPKRLFEVYQPMIDLINEQLDDSLIRLESSRDYPTYDKKLFAGYFAFALPNPYQTVTASDNGYVVFGKMGDDRNFRGIILVRKDSGIEELNDLKGKSVSYPAPTALAATMMPQWYLHTHGININKDITNNYVGSQESSIMNVYLGKTAAAATWPPPWEAFIKERPEVADEVIVKWETSSLPNNGLVARKDIPKALVNKVAKIIFSLNTNERGRKILSGMHLSKYEPADDTTYQSVKEFLIQFEKEVRPIRMNQ